MRARVPAKTDAVTVFVSHHSNIITVQQVLVRYKQVSELKKTNFEKCEVLWKYMPIKMLAVRFCPKFYLKKNDRKVKVKMLVESRLQDGCSQKAKCWHTLLTSSLTPFKIVFTSLLAVRQLVLDFFLFALLL